MELFWDQDFSATSTKALADRMDINVYSLFAEFDSKQGLFGATLERYWREVVEEIFSALDKPTAVIEEIAALFYFDVANATRPRAKYGCFACNVATERASHDAASHDYVVAHFDCLERRFRHALTNTKTRGQLRADVSCEDHAKVLVSIVLGFSVLARASLGAAPLVDAAHAAHPDLQRLMV